MQRLMAVTAATGLGALSLYIAFHVHLVQTDSDWDSVPQQKTGLTDCFASVRTWGAGGWNRHPDLKLAVTKAGLSNSLLHRHYSSTSWTAGNMPVGIQTRRVNKD